MWAWTFVGWLAVAGAADPAPIHAVKCAEPLPEFTLGEKSKPTPAQEKVLCACIWQNLGKWEREVAAKARRGEDDWRMRGFGPRFGAALEKCGGYKL